MIDIPGTLRRGWRELVAHIDFPLLLITMAIMAVGLATVYSATFDGNERIFSQAGNMGVALVIMWFVSRLLAAPRHARSIFMDGYKEMRVGFARRPA